MNIPSEDIKNMLLNEDSSFLEYTFTKDIYIGSEPTVPDNCITIFDTPGMGPMLTLDQYTAQEYPSVQIRVRNNSYKEGWNQLHDVMVALHGRANETWDGTMYDTVRCSMNPTFLSWDENGRAIFVATFDIRRKEAY